jgi:hypothetical protein
MVDCRCLKCGHLFRAATSDFGRQVSCRRCRFSRILDTDAIAHFELPDELRISVRETDGHPWRGPAIPVFLRHGYRLPPILIDESGRLAVTKEMFRRSEHDEVSMGLMDHRGEYSTVRHVEISVPSTEQGLAMANARKNSGWPILPYEKSIYGSLENLLAAYVPLEVAQVTPTHATLDLATAAPQMAVVLKVLRK